MGKTGELDDLSVPAQATFFKWREGMCVKPALRSKQRPYWYHKAEILCVLGVNIGESVAEQMPELRAVKCHGQYLIKREASLAQGSLLGILRPA